MIENNIKYIKYDKDKIEIFLINNKNIIINKLLKNYIKYLFELNMHTYISYKENITTFLKYKRLIPLYISSDIQLIYFKNFTEYQTIINYKKIKSIIKTNNNSYIKLRFIDDEIILIKTTYKSFIKKINQLKEINNYLKKQYNFLNL